VHIAEGLLSGTVLGAGWAVTAAGTAAGLRRMTPEDVPRTATLASAFFVASLVHVPLGISSAHLILNGLMGVILGVRAFPAMLVALFLQAVLFQFGGLSTLGVNTADMALPAVLCAAAMRRWIRRASPGQSFVPGFVDFRRPHSDHGGGRSGDGRRRGVSEARAPRIAGRRRRHLPF